MFLPSDEPPTAYPLRPFGHLDALHRQPLEVVAFCGQLFDLCILLCELPKMAGPWYQPFSDQSRDNNGHQPDNAETCQVGGIENNISQCLLPEGRNDVAESWICHTVATIAGDSEIDET